VVLTTQTDDHQRLARLPKDRRPVWPWHVLARTFGMPAAEGRMAQNTDEYWGFTQSLTPELTGAGGPIGPQGTNIGHQNREAMANVGVRVERFVRLARVGTVYQIYSSCLRFEYPQWKGNLSVQGEMRMFMTE
jgi:hypothetical protein